MATVKTIFSHGKDNNNGPANHVEQLKKINEDLLHARHAALNLMEDAILSKEALRESESHLAGLVESLPVAVGMADKDGKLILSNKEMQRFLPRGIIPSRDNECGWRWEAWYPDGRPVEKRNFPGSKALRGERVVPGLEMLHTNDDGTKVWTRVSSVPVKNEKDGITRIILTITDIHELISSRKQLKAFNESLEKLVEERTQELLRLKLEQQREILNAILITQEKERERIGEGLHNGIGQLLYAAAMKLELVKNCEEKDAALLTEVRKVLGDAINDVRSLSFQLIPSVLRDFGLPSAISAMINRLTSPKSEIKLESDGFDERLSDEIEFSVYRIIQELLNNCIKHSDATEINVKLRLLSGAFLVEVSDNGKGFESGQLNMQKGIGLQSISNRVKLLQANMEISSFPNKGTVIKILIKKERMNE